MCAQQSELENETFFTKKKEKKKKHEKKKHKKSKKKKTRKKKKSGYKLVTYGMKNTNIYMSRIK